jgi:FlaA1/EpsC-like NDP-sugar epimerase
VLLAFWIARDIRISTDLIPGIALQKHSLETSYLISLALISYGILGTIFAFQRLYSIDRVMGMIEEIFTLVKSVFVGFFVMVGLIYLTNGFPYETILIPRLILIFAFILTLLFIIIERLGVKHIRLFGIRRKWFYTKKVLLVMNHQEEEMERLFTSDPYTGVI